MYEAFKHELIRELAKSSTAKRNVWAHKILNENISISSLLDLLLLDQPTATRFSWMLGDLSSIDNRYTYEIIAYGFANLSKISVPDIKRVILKQCSLSEGNYPENLEGKVMSSAFEWLEDPQTSISTKEMAIKTLLALCKKHPEIAPEFKSTIQALFPSKSKSLEKKMIRLLEVLERLNVEID